jgi:hypothetical protein
MVLIGENQMIPLTPLAATVEMARLGARRRGAVEFHGLVTLAVVSGLATATVVMVATLVGTI